MQFLGILSQKRGRFPSVPYHPRSERLLVRENVVVTEHNHRRAVENVIVRVFYSNVKRAHPKCILKSPVTNSRNWARSATVSSFERTPAKGNYRIS